MGNSEKLNETKVAVYGLGAEGLMFALGLARGGHHVVGLDSDPDRIEILRAGFSYVPDISDEEVRDAMQSGCFVAAEAEHCLQALKVLIVYPSMNVRINFARHSLRVADLFERLARLLAIGGTFGVHESFITNQEPPVPPNLAEKMRADLSLQSIYLNRADIRICCPVKAGMFISKETGTSTARIMSSKETELSF